MKKILKIWHNLAQPGTTWHTFFCYNLVARRTKEVITNVHRNNKVLSSAQLLRAAERGRLKRQLELYLRSCRGDGEQDAKKSNLTFPNLAGFCRFIGCGLSSIELLRGSKPEVYDYICTVLEDEALRYSISPTVMSAYLKQRLGLGEKASESSGKSTECGQLRLVFEHDILEDGE
jgi:hypothetical protein